MEEIWVLLAWVSYSSHLHCILSWLAGESYLPFYHTEHCMHVLNLLTPTNLLRRRFIFISVVYKTLPEPSWFPNTTGIGLAAVKVYLYWTEGGYFLSGFSLLTFIMFFFALVPFLLLKVCCYSCEIVSDSSSLSSESSLVGRARTVSLS